MNMMMIRVGVDNVDEHRSADSKMGCPETWNKMKRFFHFVCHEQLSFVSIRIILA